MVKFKTNEEYILNELYKSQEELQLANKKINELEEQLKKDDTNTENMNCIYLSDKPNYWYYVEIKSTWNWNEILKINKKTPKFVEEALNDEKKLKILCNLKSKDWCSSPIAKINERIYNYLFKGRNNVYSVITTNDDSSYMYDITNKDNNFLDKDEAENYLKEKMKKYINEYLKNYKDKFEETKGGE